MPRDPGGIEMKFYFYRASVYDGRRSEFVASGVKDFVDDITPIDAIEEIVSILKKRGRDFYNPSVVFDQFHEVT